MGFNGQVGLSEMYSPSMEGICSVMDHALSGCVGVGLFVVLMMVSVLSSKAISLYLWENHKVELCWTVAPAFILVMLAFPSLQLLYLNNQRSDTVMDVKVTGHQWYWHYEVMGNDYDSYMVNLSELSAGERRLCEVDNPLIVPYGVGFRLLVSSADVLHSWAVLSLGVKVDAMPGRINSFPMFVKRPGIFYGQCSELCGVHHSHMPIVVESVKPMEFISKKLMNK